ncbi:MAG: tetratricopeptide repeat protein, partial [Candidatus Xenobia bacterium]
MSDALYARAFELDAHGERQDAINAYFTALRTDANHPEACRAALSLAQLLRSTGQGDTCVALLTQATKLWPDDPTVHVELADMLSDTDDPATAQQHYAIALQLDLSCQAAHKGLATLLLRQGNREAALPHGHLGFQPPVKARRYRGREPGVPLLMAISVGGAGVPLEQFADDRIFQNWILVCDFLEGDVDLPEHRLLCNCIGDPEAGEAALDAVSRLIRRASVPIINHPDVVRQTTRTINAKRLATIPGVRTALVEEVAKPACTADNLSQMGFTWPLLVRAPGYQLGRYFERIDRAEETAAVIAEMPGDHVLVMEYIDYASPHDGLFRKYRAMTVDGVIYPLHLAVSDSWKVHYFSALMHDNESHRKEDERYLLDMPAALGDAAMHALERVKNMVALDYGGIDFGIDKNGDVIVFETNAAMW